METLEQSCMRKIYLRLLPFAILSYFLAYIDRINVSFAALTMRGDLNISAGDYGFALGTFYWGYFWAGAWATPCIGSISRIAARSPGSRTACRTMRPERWTRHTRRATR